VFSACYRKCETTIECNILNHKQPEPTFQSYRSRSRDLRLWEQAMARAVSRVPPANTRTSRGPRHVSPARRVSSPLATDQPPASPAPRQSSTPPLTTPSRAAATSVSPQTTQGAALSAHPVNTRTLWGPASARIAREAPFLQAEQGV
jgi:hypothetical protein